MFFLLSIKRGGRVLPNPKNPFQKKTEVVKKGGGGGSQFFLLKVNKKQFFTPTLIATVVIILVNVIIVVTVDIILVIVIIIAFHCHQCDCQGLLILTHPDKIYCAALQYRIYSLEPTYQLKRIFLWEKMGLFGHILVLGFCFGQN